MLGEAFDVSRQAKKCRQRFACFSSHGFLAVCEIHSNWAVLLVILNEVEVCPLFAYLNRRQNAATAVFTLYSGAAMSIRYPLPLVPTIFLISRSLGWAQEEKNDWDVLHTISVSSMFLGRIFLV